MADTDHTQNNAPQSGQGQPNQPNPQKAPHNQSGQKPLNQQQVTDHPSQPGKPNYGQMASQYGPNYNPYLFGGPSPQQMGQQQPQQSQQPQQPNQQMPQGFGQGFGYGQSQAGSYNHGAPNQGMPGFGGQAGSQPGQGQGPQQGPQFGPWGARPPQYGPGQQGNQNPNQNSNGYGPYSFGSNQMPGQTPNPYGYPGYGFVRIDPNNPQQNPLYNHWDWISIVAFILSFASFFTFLSLPMAFIGYNRCKSLHMRGKGFAIAAIILSVLNLIWLVVLLLNPGLMSNYGSLLGSLGSSAQNTVFL